MERENIAAVSEIGDGKGVAETVRVDVVDAGALADGLHQLIERFAVHGLIIDDGAGQKDGAA